MKKILIILTLLAFPLKNSASPSYETFLKGNEAYKKNNFEEALRLYESIPNPAPHVHYNMGNAHYKLHNYGKALLQWRRAEEHWGLFNRQDVASNIALVRKELGGLEHKEQSAFASLTGTLRCLLNSIPLRDVQLSILIIAFLLLLFRRFYHYKFKLVFILFFFGKLVLLGNVLILKYSLSVTRYGVVTSQNASLYSGPSETYTNLGTIPQAYEVVIKKESDDYFKIQTRGKIAWASKQDVTEI
jgi:tetratricopeptide (TPR) repeat protein